MQHLGKAKLQRVFGVDQEFWSWTMMCHLWKHSYIKKLTSFGVVEGIWSKFISRIRLDTIYFTENWKHCSKIIFKCVNSAVRPIFNIFLNKVVVGPVNNAWTVHEQCVTQCSLSPETCASKKKKKAKRETHRRADAKSKHIPTN